jgi:hypothetical protein
MPHDDIVSALRAEPVHACPHPDCRLRLPSLIWACREHWQSLPPRIRQAIWWARREGEPSAIDATAQTALAYWRATDERLAA